MGRTYVALIALTAALPAIAQQNPNDPGVVEPCLTGTTGVETRVPHTDQADGTVFNNLVGDPVVKRAHRAVSLTGHPVTRVESPNRDMEDALDAMVDAAKDGDGAAMRAHARDLMDVLLGTTEGRVYDGFAMLNFNRGPFVADHVPGEYKMKSVRGSGLTELGIDGQEHPIGEADVAMLYYDGQIGSDTFLLRFPPEAGELDPVRIHYTIYALDGIAGAAPEKKMYQLAKAALDGASTAQIRQWAEDPDAGPRGRSRDWADLAANQRQLPPEAWDVLAAEDGLAPGDFGPCRFIRVYVPAMPQSRAF